VPKRVGKLLVERGDCGIVVGLRVGTQSKGSCGDRDGKNEE
jgi:hypothetical protein